MDRQFTEGSADTTSISFTTEIDPESNPETSKKLDLAFLIHSSEAIDYDKYDYYTQFMHEVVEKADIDSGAVRVGAAIYNADGYVVSLLNPESNPETSRKLDLAFLIHSSEAIDYDKYDYYTQFMHDVVKNADIDSGAVRVGAIIYNADGNVVFPLDRHTSSEALRAAIVEFPLQSYEAKPKIYTAGIGLKGMSWLPAIASAPEDVYSPETVQDLPSVSKPIVDKTNALSGAGGDSQGQGQLLCQCFMNMSVISVSVL
ncbi:hypothetical protein EGW08_003207 [Elysia chlorotica]|uniref:VWFA domain-containing protein n=1 Tax=Elysia chlorotica TaxID=188477 RepID=A0A3S1A2M3_ELYCH|nr:hypothetical protein EGW08_003207 [Elysia chlorotica]